MLLTPQIQAPLINFGDVDSLNTQSLVDDLMQNYNSCTASLNQQAIKEPVASTSTMSLLNTVPYEQKLETCSTVNIAENSLNLSQNISANIISDTQILINNNKTIKNTSPSIITSSSASSDVLNAVDTMRKRELEIAEFLAQCRDQQQRQQQNFSLMNEIPEARPRAFTISNDSMSLNSNITNVQQQEIIHRKHSAGVLAEQFKVSFNVK